jgi:hypothetical protein
MEVCVRCGKNNIPASEAAMSGDGWLCGACFKLWDKEQEAKQPQPWFNRDKKRLRLDDLHPATEEDLRRSQRSRALRWCGIGVSLILIGLVGSIWLRVWWQDGGVVPGVVSASPLAAVVGALLVIWGAVDWVRLR